MELSRKTTNPTRNGQVPIQANPVKPVEKHPGRKNKWWALLDSNQRPNDYESSALTAELRALT